MTSIAAIHVPRIAAPKQRGSPMNEPTFGLWLSPLPDRLAIHRAELHDRLSRLPEPFVPHPCVERLTGRQLERPWRRASRYKAPTGSTSIVARTVRGSSAIAAWIASEP